MIGMSIHLEGDNCWPDLKDTPFLDGELKAVAILDSGMTSGKPSVAIRVRLPDGQTVVAQTTARLFCMAAKAFMAKYPDLYQGD